MYFLFNELDDSYNCHSDKPFPDFMKPGTYEIQTDESFDISQYGDITLSSYNRETQLIEDNPKKMIRMKSEAGKNFLVEFFTLNEYVDSRKDPELYDMMLNFARVFLPADLFESIIADSRIDLTEAEQIINELNNIEADPDTVFDENGNIISYQDESGNTVNTNDN